MDIGTTVIIDVNITNVDALQRAAALNAQLIALKKTQDDLKKSGEQNSLQYKDNAQQLRQLEQQTKAYISLSKNNEGSINSLRAQIALLTNQYNAMSKATRDGTKAGKELKDQLKDLTDQERKATQEAGNFKSTIGNYREEIVRAGQDLLPFGSELGRTIQSIKSLSGAFVEAAESTGILKIALATTGIGAVLVLVGSLIAYLKDLDTVTDTTAQAIGGLKAGFQEFGRSILNLDFKGLNARMKQAQVDAADLVSEQQDLEDKALAQSVKSAQAQDEVAKLQIQARNRTLDPAERQRLIAEANRIDEEDLKHQKEIADEKLFIARASIQETGKLTLEQVQQLQKQGTEYALYLQNNLTTQGKVTAEQTKQLSEAEKEATRIEGEFNQRAERRANLSDRIAAQEEARQKELQAHLDEINKDRIKSALLLAEGTLTIREKEYAEINADIDKRKLLYVKYGQDTVQLERERLARLSALDAKFRQEDLATITTNIRSAQTSRTNLGANRFADPNASKAENTQLLQNQFNLDDLDKQIQAYAARIALGETELGNVLQSFIDKRIGLQKEGDQKLQDLQTERYENLTKTAQDAYLETVDLDNKALENEVANHDARIKLNEGLLSSYEDMFGTISDLATRNSTLGKVAFAIEKAFAISRIIINAELEKSAIALATAEQAALASTNPITIFAVPGILAAGIAQEAAITAREVESVAAIAAQTIAGEITGRAKGGLITGPGSGTSDSIPARLSNGESVMTAKATQMFKPWLSEMNVAGGGVPFATGGLAGSYVPNLSNQVNSDNAITRSIMAGISKQKFYVAVTDINYGQRKMAQVEGAGNF